LATLTLWGEIMKRLVLGLAVLAVAGFGLSATGMAESWNSAQRRENCPTHERPACGFGTYTVCTMNGWACMETARQEREDNRSSSYGEMGRSSRKSCDDIGPSCVAGWLPECHSGRWRCTPP
jgi:hypothetical protein